MPWRLRNRFCPAMPEVQALALQELRAPPPLPVQILRQRVHLLSAQDQALAHRITELRFPALQAGGGVVTVTAKKVVVMWTMWLAQAVERMRVVRGTATRSSRLRTRPRPPARPGASARPGRRLQAAMGLLAALILRVALLSEAANSPLPRRHLAVPCCDAAPSLHRQTTGRHRRRSRARATTQSRKAGGFPSPTRRRLPPLAALRMRQAQPAPLPPLTWIGPRCLLRPLRWRRRLRRSLPLRWYRMGRPAV